ncbi:hypothetical protein HK098_005102 [Nowakowskiella sp. JEL0407]|nr:hypothetical protein HK098_005102 [Nowakowskiella sp. JEL0407]
MYKTQPFKLSSGDTITLLSRIETPTSYATISHVWGNISGQSDDWNFSNKCSTLISSPSKLTALKTLISDHADAVWCDVYCIDQDDVSDKCAQVSIMDKIYDNCNMCLLLLDPEDGKEIRKSLEEHRQLVNLIGPMVKKIEESGDVSKADAKKFAQKAVALKEPADSARYKDMPIYYFKRAWTLQEIVYPLEFKVFTYTLPDEEGNGGGELSFIAELSTFIDAAKNAETWWHDYIFPTLVDERKKKGLTLAEENAIRHISWALINSKLFRALKGAAFGSANLSAVDVMERAENYIYNNVRNASVSHDLIYSVMKLLGINVTVDYSLPFRQILRDFYIECIQLGILHVAHFISHRDGKLELAGWNEDSRFSHSWMGDALAATSNPANTMKLFNRRWVNDMPERELPLPRIIEISEDKSTVKVHVAIPDQTIDEDVDYSDDDEITKWIGKEGDFFTGKKVSELEFRFVDRILENDCRLIEVIGKDDRLLITFAYDSEDDLVMGRVGYSREKWDSTDKIVRIGRSFLYLDESLTRVKQRVHIQSFHQSNFSDGLLTWLDEAFGEENDIISLI